MSFPIFDEMQFRRVFRNHKDTISPGLLSHLYGNAMVFWPHSQILKSIERPDIYTVWIQCENALTTEFSCTPGVSTIITYILNLCGRPSTHILNNGSLVGMASE
jgi:hypothetical protein